MPFSLQSAKYDVVTGSNHDTDSDDSDRDEYQGLLSAYNNLQRLGSTYQSVQEDVRECKSFEDEENGAPVDAKPTQNSLVTIFSLGNTMMGTSLLSMPWAIEQAGFANGIVLMMFVAGVMGYSSYIVLDAWRYSGAGIVSDFTGVVRIYLGKMSEAAALLCSLLTLTGGATVYWILMSNFLYHIGKFAYHRIHIQATSDNRTVLSCNDTHIPRELPELFKTLWSETLTVPLYLIVIFFPLFNFKSPTFFTKFNALGAVSVLYLLFFVVFKAGDWGVNLDFHPDHSDSLNYSPHFSWSFPALTGVAALAYLVQNSLTTILKNQKHPENNTRDLIIAYILVCFIYTFVGTLFYATFPGGKFCVRDNLLNNLPYGDTLAFVARVFFFFQMACIIPQVFFVFRSQLLHFLFGKTWPGRLHVMALNAALMAVCITFAIFFPKIGHIISFVGAFCGFSYAIAFPCIVHLVICYRNKTLTWIKTLLHSFLIALGLANFVGQFVIIGHTSP